ncbi:hypothetical protein GCM10009536_55840 [Streptomyces thermocarboxydus]
MFATVETMPVILSERAGGRYRKGRRDGLTDVGGGLGGRVSNAEPWGPPGRSSTPRAAASSRAEKYAHPTMR